MLLQIIEERLVTHQRLARPLFEGGQVFLAFPQRAPHRLVDQTGDRLPGVAAGGSFASAWNQSIPALGTVIGDNLFALAAEDVTPAPWNQPPYPPSGDTAAASCMVTGVAP